MIFTDSKILMKCITIGVYEYIDSSKFCFFEWPEVANEIFTDKYLKIFIRVNNSKRIINIVSR